LIGVGLMLVWAVHDGGYDADTWYWGALLTLVILSSVVWARRGSITLSRTTRIALSAFALYVAWSYLSIAWAESKGDAFDGSNRALLYLLLFSLFVVLPWTPGAALTAMVTFALGLGVIAIVLLVRLASSDHVGALVIDGRLAAPTGYFNATAALFTIAALLSIALAARRDLAPELRGLLTVAACAALQLDVIVQSRGWLFTLPLVGLIAVVVVRDRLRFAAAAVLPVLAAVIPIDRLLNVYKATSAQLPHAAGRAGTTALVICGVVLVVATLIASAERVFKPTPLSSDRRRALGIALAILVIAGGSAGAVAATHGHPFKFIERQWNGFSHEPTTSAGSHFADVGSGRYDFWRVALKGFGTHPIGGLGQDNFGDYYLLHRRTSEEPAWPHSLELRLLVSTGIVGFLLFGTWLVQSLRIAARARRVPGIGADVAGIALLPFVVWLIHGSIDWFWEMPAITGPALAFLGTAVALAEQHRSVLWRRTRPRRIPRAVTIGALCVAELACVFALGSAYLSVREVSNGSDASATDPAGALRDFKLAEDFNPLSSVPGRLGGLVALENGRFLVAEQRFRQSLSNQPLGWVAWLGEGLAASELGDRAAAHRDFIAAARIDSRQAAVKEALARVYSGNPLTPSEALGLLAVHE
jgi:multisubunit Na+/H+ antiporter MnhB subunit